MSDTIIHACFIGTELKVKVPSGIMVDLEKCHNDTRLALLLEGDPMVNELTFEVFVGGLALAGLLALMNISHQSNSPSDN